jgi:serine/threonine-protein kinase
MLYRSARPASPLYMADSQQQPKSDPLLGKVLGGRYRIHALIDRGGMGKVYKAEQQPLGRMVALKTLDLMDPSGEFQQRFFNEASIASRLTHPNTVRIFDYGRSDEGVYFLTMELLDGQSLHRTLKSDAPLDPLRLIAIMRQVCGALEEAHQLGIVHRDLKPGNVFLTRHGDDLEFAKVLDFGLVKNLESDVSLSQTGQTLGSPLYMSPEQVEGEKVDRRADIYSLGLVMYVALTGKVPFKKGSVATIMMQQVTARIPTFDEIAPSIDIPASMEWIVRRCIEKDRDARFATMREVSVALKLCARELRGELPTIPWKLAPDGTLDLPEDLLGKGQETAAGTVIDEAEAPTRQDVRQVDDHRVDPAAATAIAPANDIPSSPTLNRSTAGVAAGAVVAGGGLIVGLVVVGLLLVGLILGVALYWASAPTPQPAPPPIQPAVLEEPTPEPSPEPAPAPAPERVKVKLDSFPPGAEVLKNGSFIGTTPLTVDVTDGEVELVIQKSGYRERSVLLDGSKDTLLVPLNTRGGGPPPPPDPAPPPRPVPEPSPDPEPMAPQPVAPAPIGGGSDLRNPFDDG